MLYWQPRGAVQLSAPRSLSWMDAPQIERHCPLSELGVAALHDGAQGHHSKILAAFLFAATNLTNFLGGVMLQGDSRSEGRQDHGANAPLQTKARAASSSWKSAAPKNYVLAFGHHVSPYDRSIPRGLRRVVSTTAAAFGLGLEDVRSSRRGSADISFARQVAMYLAHARLGLPFAATGRLYHRDRTTARHACRQVEDRREDPPGRPACRLPRARPRPLRRPSAVPRERCSRCLTTRRALRLLKRLSGGDGLGRPRPAGGRETRAGAGWSGERRDGLPSPRSGSPRSGGTFSAPTASPRSISPGSRSDRGSSSRSRHCDGEDRMKALCRGSVGPKAATDGPCSVWRSLPRANGFAPISPKGN